MTSLKQRISLRLLRKHRLSIWVYEPQIEEYSAREIIRLGIPQGRCAVTEGGWL